MNINFSKLRVIKFLGLQKSFGFLKTMNESKDPVMHSRAFGFCTGMV